MTTIFLRRFKILICIFISITLARIRRTNIAETAVPSSFFCSTLSCKIFSIFPHVFPSFFMFSNFKFSATLTIIKALTINTCLYTFFRESRTSSWSSWPSFKLSTKSSFSFTRESFFRYSIINFFKTL